MKWILVLTISTTAAAAGNTLWTSNKSFGTHKHLFIFCDFQQIALDFTFL
jgi:hypothetical protein